MTRPVTVTGVGADWPEVVVDVPLDVLEVGESVPRVVVVVPVDVVPLVELAVPVDVVWLNAGSSRTAAVASETPRTRW
jgi:hypothetical protein